MRPRGYVPMKTPGWNAIESLVQDPDALAAKLAEKGSPFSIAGVPRSLGPNSPIRAMQAIGPANEVLYLTNVPPGSPVGRSATTFVDRPFIMIVGGTKLDAMREFYRDSLGLEVGNRTSKGRITVLNRAFGLDLDTTHSMGMAQVSPQYSLELDEYPSNATERPTKRGELPPAIAMVGFEVESLDGLKVPLLAPPRRIAGAPYDGRRVAVTRGAAGELIEMIERGEEMNNDDVANTGGEPSFSRRSLLEVAAATTALSAMPWSVRRAFAQESAPLVIIGGGTAGLMAAIFAADRGARPIVIEKASTIGGTLFVSGGMMGAAGTVFQKRKGIEDSPDSHYNDIMRISDRTADRDMARLWADNAGATVNWLAENGLTIPDDQPVKGTQYDEYSVARYHWGAQNGRSILAVMKPLFDKRVQEGRITLLTDAGAVDLLKDAGGAIGGVVIEDSSGKRSDMRARTTVIATGGCAANATMFENLHGVPLYRKAAYPTSQGMGLSLGQAAGGYLRCADNYVGYFGSIATSDQIPSPPFANMSIDVRQRPAWEVFVNSRGERFVREDHPSMSARDRTMDHQPGHRFWAIFDQRILDEAPPLIPGWSRDKLVGTFNKHPMFTRGATLAELGVVTGIDPAGLERTIRAYNMAVEKRTSDPFGRSHRPLPLSRAPFYAIRSQTWTLKSYAGIAVNKSLQVVTKEGRPVPNLYAAGEVLGAATGGRAHTNGASVTPALTFGRLLGQKILPL